LLAPHLKLALVGPKHQLNVYRFLTDNIAGNVAVSIMWFIVAMLNYPETLNKAQAEIDLIVGADGKTVPDLSHIRDLPYTVALTKEVFR
jgi:hypothetical protein